MIGIFESPAERAHSAAAWAALVSGAPGPDQPPETERERFLRERQERIDSDLSWSGDPEPEGDAL